MTIGKSRNALNSAKTARILRFLEKSGGEAKAVVCDGANIRLECDGRSLAVSRDLIAAIEREALAVLKRSTCQLTPLGQDRLKAWLSERIESAQNSNFDGRGLGKRTSESPLDRLYLRGGRSGKAWLSEAEFKAGERLRQDFECGRLQPRVTVNWDTSPGRVRGRSAGGGMELSDFALDARLRVEKALGTLQAGLAGIALDVCCFLKGLEQVERERQWPPRSAKLMLKTALAGLAEHYGLVKSDRRKHGNILHWGDDNYRPNIEPPA
jgi:Domain of unknown function (DUF6456)